MLGQGSAGEPKALVWTDAEVLSVPAVGALQGLAQHMYALTSGRSDFSEWYASEARGQDPDSAPLEQKWSAGHLCGGHHAEGHLLMNLSPKYGLLDSEASPSLKSSWKAQILLERTDPPSWPQ